MFSDTLSNSMTILYSSLNLQNPTNNLSIVSNGIDNSISSVFVNYVDAGFFFNFLQIIICEWRFHTSARNNKKPFSKLKKN